MAQMLFYSSFLKIKRANKHIDDLNSLWNTFVSENRHFLIFQEQAKPPRKILKPVTRKPLPFDFNLIAGDAVHNLRTALDHIVCTLIKRNNKAINTSTGFPIHGNREKFEAGFKGKIAGCPENSFPLFEAVQAYPGGEGNNIWNLNMLDVADKHRELLLAAQSIKIPKATVKNPDGETLASILGTSLTGNAAGMAFPIDSVIEFENNAKPIMDIVFVKTPVFESESVIGTLKALSEEVNHIVLGFEAVLGADKN